MSSEQDNTQLVQRAYAAFGQGDIPAVLALMADDVEWSEPGSADVLPWGGPRRGRQQAAAFFQELDRALTFEAFEPREFIAQGETVVVVGYERTVVKSSGHRVENDWVMVFTIRDGKIARFREYYDTAPYLAALRSS
jgi:uncharacterized protein